VSSIENGLSISKIGDNYHKISLLFVTACFFQRFYKKLTMTIQKVQITTKEQEQFLGEIVDWGRDGVIVKLGNGQIVGVRTSEFRAIREGLSAITY
jgi:hypothetical protein